MKFILIVICTAFTINKDEVKIKEWPHIVMQEFNNQKACETAATLIKNNTSDNYGTKIFCLPQGK
jgi:hypothetical protein